MVGITSHGAHIPMLRLPLGAIAGGGRKATGGSGEKAVANFDGVFLEHLQPIGIPQMRKDEKKEEKK